MRAYWINHKQLSRAERFATGETAELIAKEKKFLFDTLSERLKQAQIAESAQKKKLQERYAKHLEWADRRAEKLYQKGIQQQNENYRQQNENYLRLAQIAESSYDVDELEETAEKLEEMGNYQNNRQLAKSCRNRAIREKIRKLQERKTSVEREMASLNIFSFSKKKELQNLLDSIQQELDLMNQ